MQWKKSNERVGLTKGGKSNMIGNDHVWLAMLTCPFPQAPLQKFRVPKWSELISAKNCQSLVFRGFHGKWGKTLAQLHKYIGTPFRECPHFNTLCASLFSYVIPTHIMMIVLGSTCDDEHLSFSYDESLSAWEMVTMGHAISFQRLNIPSQPRN